MENIMGKLKSCQRPIKQWVKKQSHATDEIIESRTRDLELMQKGDVPVDLVAERVLKDEIHGMLEQQDLKWKQRAKEDLLRHGDRNTKFFHACTSQRKRGNTILEVKDGNGRNCDTQVEIEGAFVTYYQELFKSEAAQHVESCISAIKEKITPDMGAGLLAEFTKEEVHSALKHMPPQKAPEPDGYTVDFYQLHWDTMGSEVCDAALHFLNSSNMVASINATI